MFDIYAFATPNSIKVPIALEELGLGYGFFQPQAPAPQPLAIRMQPSPSTALLGRPYGGGCIMTELQP